jgi:hypothetical protein
MITGDQIVCHLAGDYVLQSDWMANEKVKRFLPAAIHAMVYSLSFLFLRPSIPAWLAILVPHYLIDRYRLARYVVWAKNWMCPQGSNLPWRECAATGYPGQRPAWMAVWLLIIADNTLHLLCNGLALRLL